ncbi:flagellar brake protein [Clostridium ihumii]|uniref:flagellar brake protein n=1 Tax=Clostridium ihumii TaxID=1470356 RepID=UPI00058B4F33|nr:flagellar brake domain-containing protein [Clostridium ihumii]
MSNIKFHPNTKLEIITEDGYAKTIIQDVEDENIAILIPTINSTYVAMRQGEKYEAIYNDKKGGVYKFKFDVEGRKYDKVPLIVLGEPYDIKKIQRRKYVRISYTGIINYYLLKTYPKKELMSYDILDFKVGYTVDLSGGGIRMRMSEKPDLDDYMIINLNLNEEIIILGKVVRIEEDGNGKYLCGIDFLEIEETEREKVIRYIFMEMRRMLKTSGGEAL